VAADRHRAATSPSGVVISPKLSSTSRLRRISLAPLVHADVPPSLNLLGGADK
jgi:hypothetical protein